MWVEFLADHDHRPTANIWQTFAKGEIRNVPALCAIAAIAAGRARRTKRPARASDAPPPADS
jgi:hypothetical protein